MKFTCEGGVRGCCGINHKTYAAAAEHCSRDAKNCRALTGRSYSDRKVVAADDEAEAVIVEKANAYAEARYNQERQ